MKLNVDESWIANTHKDRGRLQLVKEVVQREGLLGQSLALSRLNDNLADLVALVEWVALHVLPVVEDALREGLATSVGAQISGEAWECERQRGWRQTNRRTR
jgi:hypothetical protein